MQAFLDEDFLLTTPTARTLYHQVAEQCPIIDYHCHISPKEIWEDLRYENITQVWLGGDHYKWRLMRWAGVPEQYITGDASDYEKFMKWAEVIEKAIGNPLYHWSHLELRRYFGYEGVLNRQSADTVWHMCNQKLRTPGYSVRELIARSHVETICTTDDPADTLEWHQRLAGDAGFQTAVLPAWRPDRAMNLDKADYLDYLDLLAAASSMHIMSFADLKAALTKRMNYFNENHCRLSDHGLGYVMYAPATEQEVEAIFAKRLLGQSITGQEKLAFQTAFMLFSARRYRAMGWTMQLHYGCRRNNHPRMFAKVGADTGFDCIDTYTPLEQTAAFLGALEAENALPQTILYSLNPNDNAAIDSLCGCFQNDEAAGKVQHGSAWWFNDHFAGITDQLVSLASTGYLASFIGMLTDSRSFLSYPRHEYFRRILCRQIGIWVEEGAFPQDMEVLGDIVRGICYENAKRYFGLKGKA